MEHLTPLRLDLDSKSNEDLLEAYDFNSEPSPVPFFPVFAKRIEFFKDIVFQEVIAEKNTLTDFRMMKPSWMIMISVLDYCEDVEVLKELAEHIKNYWEKDDYESFVKYISSEERFLRFF